MINCPFKVRVQTFSSDLVVSELESRSVQTRVVFICVSLAGN